MSVSPSTRRIDSKNTQPLIVGVPSCSSSHDPRVTSIGERSIVVDRCSSSGSILGRLSTLPIPNTTKCKITKCDGQISVEVRGSNSDDDLDALSKYLAALATSGEESAIHISIQMGNRMTYEKLSAFMCNHKKYLHALDLRSVHIDDDHLKMLLESCCNLVHLYVKSNNVTEDGLSGLSHLQRLQTLDLNGCRSVIKLKLPILRELKTLALSLCESLVSLELPELPSLKTVNLCLCTSLLTVILGPLPSLQLLDFSECTSLISLALVVYPKLQRLILGSCSDLVALRLAHVPALDHIDLSDCKSLTALHLPDPLVLKTFDISRSSRTVFAKFAPLLSDISKITIKKTG